ncbi:protein Wnt-5a-like protein [Lates japonicus]|uniref:Protein Wnt-5a-like protein n=1 Tax=Lates japonicus TaxID=270547 RepID=A0AAD3QVV5_LATJO|nr:protein Wnt-5a-like protein [Lates japonicus]
MEGKLTSRLWRGSPCGSLRSTFQEIRIKTTRLVFTAAEKEILNPPGLHWDYWFDIVCRKWITTSNGLSSPIGGSMNLGLGCVCRPVCWPFGSDTQITVSCPHTSHPSCRSLAMKPFTDPPEALHHRAQLCAASWWASQG